MVVHAVATTIVPEQVPALVTGLRSGKVCDGEISQLV